MQMATGLAAASTKVIEVPKVKIKVKIEVPKVMHSQVEGPKVKITMRGPIPRTDNQNTYSGNMINIS